ncbi:MAG TPA: inorganic phosphate transporter, partial [Arthrobacter sp.]|nr:inorganic phosphate transporter [Arthrobacter sp.]
VLIAGGFQAAGTGPEFWVILSCALAIAIGTYSGGWRIIRTMGSGLTEVKPAQGFAAESSTASAILASSHLGFALSTTQVASGSVIGSGLGRKGAKVRWDTAGRIGIGWLLTLPAAGGIGALAAFIAHLGVVGVVIDAVAGAAVIGLMYIISKRNQIGHDNAISHVDQAGEIVRIKRKKKRKAAAKKRAKQQAGLSADRLEPTAGPDADPAHARRVQTAAAAAHAAGTGATNNQDGTDEGAAR